MPGEGGRRSICRFIWNTVYGRINILQPKQRFSHQFHQVTRQVVFSGNFQERPGVQHTLLDDTTSQQGPTEWAERSERLLLSPTEASPQHGMRSYLLPPGPRSQINREHSQQNEGLRNANLPCTRILTKQTKGRISNELQVPFGVTRCALAPQLTSLVAAVSPAWTPTQQLHRACRRPILLKFQVTNNDHCACGSHTFQNIHKWWQVNK